MLKHSSSHCFIKVLTGRKINKRECLKMNGGGILAESQVWKGFGEKAGFQNFAKKKFNYERFQTSS